MPEEAAHEDPGEPVLLSDRYRVEAILGRGGMAVVYRAHDVSTGCTVALKRLTVESSDVGEDAAQLFEQEFHTLSDLSHPRVIEVYDYVKDPSGAFYTMELLEGGDLRELAPLPFRRVCAVLRDVCSALSLLHSRRLVHRDLTPRNVRCTADGKAKLIDFGAMARVGPCKQIVGTPSFIAPEAASAQVVDGRTDLFSLGATAYYALTGRHAYPSRSLVEAREAWQVRPSPPSRYAPDVPQQLDDLVLALLELEPVARPSSAGEVMERLGAIADLPADEELVVHRAYLNDPTLVGREELLEQVRSHVGWAARGRGGSLVVTGAPGTGRSRFLDACVLEAKLAGAVVLRADAGDSAAGDFAAARTLGRQLLQASPEAAKRRARASAQLSSFFPELDPSRSGRPPSERPGPALPNPPEHRARTLEAFRDWFFASAAGDTVLVVAVDDLERLDEPSAALVALLASRSHRRRVFVVCTADGEAAPTEALEVVRRSGAALKLRPLDARRTLELLRAVFGDAPGVKLVADRVHAVSGGKPRAIMQLAQHLVDEGIVRYEAGSFTLPEQLDPADLPPTAADALHRRLAALDPAARALAEALSLSSKTGFSLRECSALLGSDDAGAAARALAALAAAEVVIGDRSHYSLAHPSLGVLLRGELAPERARELHSMLGQSFLSQPVTERFHAAQHLLRGGNRARALDAALEYIAAATEHRTGGLDAYFEFVKSLPEGWLETLETLLDVATELGRPTRDRFDLRFNLVSLASVTALTPVAHVHAAAEQLRKDSGLDLYADLDPATDPGARLGVALGAARARFEATPEGERGLAPLEAIQWLAQLVLRTIGLAGRGMDYALLEALPSLEPFAALSPAVSIIERNREGTLHVLAGRTAETRRINLEIAERMDQPDGAGLAGSDHTNMRCAIVWAVASIEIQSGVQAGLRYAEEIERSPLFEVNASRLRLLNAIRQGESARAEELLTHLELLRVQNRPPQLFEGYYLATLTMSYAGCQDLVRVKELIPGLEAMADELPTWQPCLHYARAVYQSLRGNHEGAVTEALLGLSGAPPGRHLMWAPIAGLHLSSLVHEGRAEEAGPLADEYMAAVDRERIDTISTYVRQAAALVAVALGDHARAYAYADHDLAVFEAMGSTGVPIGSVYETKARIAMAARDEAKFVECSARCAKEYRVGENGPLTAKFERLLRDARRNGLSPGEGVRIGAVPGADDRLETRVATLLSTCRGPGERAARVLDVLMEASASKLGFLYTMQRDGPVLAAQRGDEPPPDGLDTAVSTFVRQALHEEEQMTVGTSAGDLTGLDFSFPDDVRLQPVLLGHTTDSGYVITGAALINRSPDAAAPLPFSLAAVLSKSLMRAGDVATVMMPR